jgi:carbohydrate diacid regulator
VELEKGAINRLDDELLKTIQSFFENNLHVSKTAEALFIHRNTMVWRLEEIERRTGLNLENFGTYIAEPIAKIIAALYDPGE